MHMVLFGKSLHRIGSMLPNPLNQITSNTNIKCAISLTGQKVNSRLFHDNTFYHLDSRLRGNDGRVPAIVNFANAEFHACSSFRGKSSSFLFVSAFDPPAKPPKLASF
jgi:hypothetical protein